MKHFIAVMLFALAAGQAQAGGFYQAVVGERSDHSAEFAGRNTPFNYSPLYLQVTGNTDRLADREEPISRTVPMFSYTPLYLKVSGQS
jgi:hypothetical protein